MPRLDAVATTFNSAWEILVLGRRTDAMAQAVNRLLAMGGGLTAVQDGRTEFELALPIGGVMSYESMESLARKSEALLTVLRSHGYAHHDPLFTLFFLCADFLPEARLTPRGLWNVKERRIVAEPEPLRGVSRPGGH
jgi:adenine deaminase